MKKENYNTLRTTIDIEIHWESSFNMTRGGGVKILRGALNN